LGSSARAQTIAASVIAPVRSAAIGSIGWRAIAPSSIAAASAPCRRTPKWRWSSSRHASQPRTAELEALERVRALRGGDYDRLRESALHPVDDPREHLFLRAEVVVEGTLREAGARDDVVDGRRSEPLLREERLGRGEERSDGDFPALRLGRHRAEGND
jgi:hypothetical protein